MHHLVHHDVQENAVLIVVNLVEMIRLCLWLDCERGTITIYRAVSHASWQALWLMHFFSA